MPKEPRVSRRAKSRAAKRNNATPYERKDGGAMVDEAAAAEGAPCSLFDPTKPQLEDPRKRHMKELRELRQEQLELRQQRKFVRDGATKKELMAEIKELEKAYKERVARELEEFTLKRSPESYAEEMDKKESSRMLNKKIKRSWRYNNKIMAAH